MNKLSIPPSQAGYAFKRTAEYLHFPLAGGLGRTRRDLIDSSRLLTVKWTVSKAGYEYLQQVYAYFVANATEAFLIDLIIDTADPVEHVAKFVPKSFRLESVQGIRYVVAATIEALPADYTEWPAYAGDVGCDCSHIAWIQYDEGLIIDEDWHLPTLRGTATITDGLLKVHISEIDPLYGTSSIVIDSSTDGASEITLSSPSVFISDAWTLNYSFKADPGFFGDPGYLSVTLWTEAGERFRLETSDDGGGGLNFFYFDASTFNSGSVYGYSTDVVHNIEISAGDGQAHIFIDGVQVFNPDSTAGASVINRVTFYNQISGVEGAHMQIDEIRVTNRVEHTADYAVSLPFCICGPEEFPDPWLWYPTTGTEADYENFSPGPIHKLTYQFKPLNSAPEPYVTNVTILDSFGDGNNNFSVTDLFIPLFGPLSVPTEGQYTWEPADPEDTIVPTFTTSDPSSGVWVGATMFVSLSALGGPMIGWGGGVLTLHAGNDIDDVRTTIITFLPSSFVYPPVQIAYGPLS